MQSLKASIVAGLCAVLAAPSARAQLCGRADLVSALPPDGASSVPTDATLHAYYGLSADYLGEDVSLEHGSDSTVLPASFDQNEGDLSVTPTLVPGEAYVLHWPGLRGINTANLGSGKDVHFTVGSGGDSQAPDFDGITRIDWDVDRQHDTCTDAPEERYVFDLSLAPASDDGGADLLTLLVFQTRGPTMAAGAAPIPVMAGAMPAPGTKVRVARTLDDGAGRVCFASLARDLTGKVSSGGPLESCVTTATVPFFNGCTVTRSTRSTGRSLGAILATALLSLVFYGRRIATRRSSQRARG